MNKNKSFNEIVKVLNYLILKICNRNMIKFIKFFRIHVFGK